MPPHTPHMTSTLTFGRMSAALVALCCAVVLGACSFTHQRQGDLWATSAPEAQLAARDGFRVTRAAMTDSAATKPTALRVVSYNIALGYALEARNSAWRMISRDSYSIRAALKKHPDLRDFDILGVQEVCSDNGGRQLKRLAALGPYHVVFGRADMDRNGECRKGQAIVSRFPVEASGTLHLPQIRRIGRSAVWADVTVPTQDGRGQPLRVYNIHLDNRGESFFASEGRWVQMQAILAHIDAWRTEHPDTPLILLGDFNSLGDLVNPWDNERTIRELRDRFISAIPEYKSTHVLSHQLDWIFHDTPDALQIRRAKVVGVVRSDHLPVVVDFELRLHPNLDDNADGGVLVDRTDASPSAPNPDTPD